MGIYIGDAGINTKTLKLNFQNNEILILIK
jgi:hypothetical protein